MRQVVRAIIKNEKDQLLTIKRVKNGQVYWVLPGGGVDEIENNQQALIRECQEELGVEVEVGEFLSQYFYDNPEFSRQKEFFYFCKIIGGELGTGDGPEFQENSKYEGTREIQWLKFSELGNFDLRPKEIKNKLQ